MRVIGSAVRYLNKRLQPLGIRLVRRPLGFRRIARIAPYGASARKLLSSALLEPVTVGYKEPDNSLYRLSKSLESVDKWHHYFDVYERELSRFRDRPIRILEIGVFRGGSLRMWKEWFHPDSTVIGIDIEPRAKDFEEPESGILVRVGDQTNGHFLTALTAELGPFDIILDDGGHMTSQMISSFNHLFRPALKDSGVYIVEDIHTNYWTKYIDSAGTFIGLVAGVVDIIHEPYIAVPSVESLRVPVCQKSPAPLRMPYIAAHISRLTVWDSMVVIEKGTRSRPRADSASPEYP